MKYVDGFNKQKSDALLQHTPRRLLPKGHKTVFHPLQATTIDKSTVEGNLHIHNDIYCVQLGKDPADLNKLAIPTFNDQLTNARIRGGQILRQKDVTPFDHREILQLAFGGFHLAMNLIWGILENHRGTVNQIGSLTHLFAIMEKTHLGSKHPDYHTLLAALTQILHGLILNALQIECGAETLDDFAKTNPSPEEIFSLAQKVMVNYTVPEPHFSVTNMKVPLQDLNLNTGSASEMTDAQASQVDNDDSEAATEPDEAVIYHIFIKFFSRLYSDAPIPIPTSDYTTLLIISYFLVFIFTCFYDSYLFCSCFQYFRFLATSYILHSSCMLHCFCTICSESL